MLHKTIKITFGIVALTTFLSACTSTGTTESTQATTSTVEPAPVATSTGQEQTTVTQVSAPTETVFYFDFDSAVLRADSRALLSAHAANLIANPRNVRLEGHADERGTREYNIALGERRALAVRSYLQSEGVNSDIEVVSYGEEKPAVDASNEYSWQQNRRVEIK